MSWKFQAALIFLSHPTFNPSSIHSRLLLQNVFKIWVLFATHFPQFEGRNSSRSGWNLPSLLKPHLAWDPSPSAHIPLAKPSSMEKPNTNGRGSVLYPAWTREQAREGRGGWTVNSQYNLPQITVYHQDFVYLTLSHLRLYVSNSSTECLY